MVLFCYPKKKSQKQTSVYWTGFQQDALTISYMYRGVPTKEDLRHVESQCLILLFLRKIRHGQRCLAADYTPLSIDSTCTLLQAQHV